MRRNQRRDSAREWISSGAAVTVRTYTRRYGVDRYTAYDDLTALGVTLPASARQWPQRPAAVPRSKIVDDVPPGETGWIAIEGRSFFVVGFTPGGVPCGVFDDDEFDGRSTGEYDSFS